MIHLARDGTQLGQFTLEQVNDMLGAGQLRPTDLAWREGLPGWVALSSLEGVALPAPWYAAPAPAAAPQPAPVEAVSSTPASVYAPPRSNISQPASYATQVSPGTVLALRQTRPWVLFLAVLGIIVTALMVLGGISAIAVGGMGSIGMGGAGASYMIGFMVAYLVVGLLYIYPIIKLFKYSGAIRRLTQSNSVRDLEEALGEQKSFWKFVGVLTLVLMVVYFVVIAVAGVTAFNSARTRASSPPAFPAPSSTP